MATPMTERVEIQVPVNMGPLVGNTLRQFAMRGSNTWQAAAYKLGSKEGTFGVGGGYSFSYLEFYKGKLVCPDGNANTAEKLCKFSLQGSDYVCGNMVIKNLGKLQAPSLDVCLVYASGSRTAEQNYAVVKRLCPQDVDDYVAVPSRHTPVIKFRFEVAPFDQKVETLVIEATPGAVRMARESAVKALSGLNIEVP